MPLVKEYYTQRASAPGTLLIAEGMAINRAIDFLPGLYTEEHARKWREVTDAVHAKGSYIFAQFAGVGRIASPEVLARQTPPKELIGPSAIAVPPGPSMLSSSSSTPPVPRPMTHDEIRAEIADFAESVRLAVDVAGFDGVELHACTGSLVEQFLRDVSNVREDEYGGSIERRARFPLEVVEAMVNVAGADRVGVRVTPFNTNFGMTMQDPIPTYTYFASELRKRFPSLAYLHAVEARGADYIDEVPVPTQESLDFLRRIWAGPGRVFISAGGYTRETAIARAEESAELYEGMVELVAFGRRFISNPDIHLRLKENLPLNAYDRTTFYQFGDASGKGYTDYPFYGWDDNGDASKLSSTLAGPDVAQAGGNRLKSLHEKAPDESSVLCVRCLIC
ncbi:hypothetical protein HGRIS_013793 [Hohenbuehelia grisea]|uniref:NADH:flavin oxidoreductase/NADH oxidase N-terminal domain-containing protein n=1 Tax=Hohenbuehelia grisea TaxID=104357 RepID=A0ABR3IWN1_9AGAR